MEVLIVLKDYRNKNSGGAERKLSDSYLGNCRTGTTPWATTAPSGAIRASEDRVQPLRELRFRKPRFFQSDFPGDPPEDSVWMLWSEEFLSSDVRCCLGLTPEHPESQFADWLYVSVWPSCDGRRKILCAQNLDHLTLFMPLSLSFEIYAHRVSKRFARNHFVNCRQH